MRVYRLVGVVVVVVLLMASAFLHDPGAVGFRNIRGIRHERLVRLYDPPSPVVWLARSQDQPQEAARDVTGVIAGAILGGFRGPAANLLWLKMEHYWHSEEWHNCYYVMRTVTWLDPHFVEAWRILGWHLMYNMPVETKDVEMQEKYLLAGANALKEGIAWNPDIYDLYWELGWNYFDKVDDFENAPKWLRAATEFEHPGHIERLIAHAYEKLPDLDKALDWYDYCLKRYPRDGTAIGATLTIRERYLLAWRLMEAGEFEQASAAMQHHLAMEPDDHIGNRLLATIYERMGNIDRALKTWDYLRHTYALDSGAGRRVRELKTRLGIPETTLERQERLQKERLKRLQEEHTRRHMLEEHGIGAGPAAGP